MAKAFRAPISVTFQIVEAGKVVGHIRVRPSGILWRRKGKHTWRRVTIDQFATFARRHGETLEK
jgi:hypothetical protein